MYKHVVRLDKICPESLPTFWHNRKLPTTATMLVLGERYVLKVSYWKCPLLPLIVVWQSHDKTGLC